MATTKKAAKKKASKKVSKKVSSKAPATNGKAKAKAEGEGRQRLEDMSETQIKALAHSEIDTLYAAKKRGGDEGKQDQRRTRSRLRTIDPDWRQTYEGYMVKQGYIEKD